MKPDKISSYIGFALKAGRASTGEFAVEKAVKGGKAHLVIIADDASANTKKKFTDMCRYYGVPLIVFKSKEELGRIAGKDERASVSINDSGLAKAIRDNVSLK